MRATAGLVPIEAPGVENANVTALCDGHFAYLQDGAIPAILEGLSLV